MDLFSTAKGHLRSVKNYQPGKPLEELQRELGIRNAVKMASNENALGPSPKAVAAMRRALGRTHRYPDGGCFYLRKKLAASLKVPPEQLVFGNGSDELLVMAARAFVTAGEEVLIADPTFLIYEIAGSAENGRIVKVPMRHFRYDLEGMARRINERTRLIFIANPDNPVGTYIPEKPLAAFLERVPEATVVVLDEAYGEYAAVKKDYPDSRRLLRRFPNLMVTRTFSKAYGLAGLRVGYALSSPGIVAALNKVREPFNVNLLAQEAAVAALDDKRHLRRTIRSANEGRSYLTKELSKLGLSSVDTVTNFVLFDLKRDATPAYERLLKRGVIVRPMTAWGLKTFMRVTIGKPADNRRFIKALKNALVLFLFFLTCPFGTWSGGTAFADVIENKSGQRLEGMITAENDKQLTIDVDGMELTLERSDIRSITRGPVQKKRKPAVSKPAEAPAPPPAPAASGMDISKLEKPVIVFDERNWKLGYQNMANSQLIAEFVLEGESVQTWTELVTAQLFIGLRTEPKYFVQYVKEKTAATCANTRWQVLKETPYDVMYEWNVEGCEGIPDQSEIARAILGVDGLHVLHYAIKLGEMPAENRKKWIEGLLASQIVKPQT